MKKLYVVGMGPGDHDSMTIRADRVLRECDVIVGYTVYVELAEQYYPEKEFLTTPMRRETERCRLAFSEASKGRTTAMICSGDAGVYGMGADPGDRAGIPGGFRGDRSRGHGSLLRSGGAGGSADA